VGGAVVVSILIYRHFRPEPFAPSPNAFSVTRPQEPPPGRPVVKSPGELALGKGRSLLYKGRAAEAVPLLAEAASYFKNDADVHFLYAQSLWQSGEREASISEYTSAADVAPPGAADYRLDLARALANLGRNREAAVEYERLLGERPEASGYLRELSNLYVQMGQAEKAIPLLRRAADAAQGDYVRVDLASALEQAGAYEEAEKVYREIIVARPNSSAGRVMLADLLSRSERAGEAVQVLQEGVEQAPESPSLHRQLASLLERTGRTTDAVRHYREYVRLAPRARDAQEVAERAAQLEGGSEENAPSAS
jgi:tetratricopeptide (TPR) repeat protein